MFDYVTPLEEAVLDAHELATGLAAMALIQDLIDKGRVADAILKDRTATQENRLTALADCRHINSTLNLIAVQRSLLGIGG